MNSVDYVQLTRDAAWVAEKAVMLLKAQQKEATIVIQKKFNDFATSADYASEKLIIDFIRQKYPSHHIFSEEAGDLKGNSEYRWIIDPLDGTKEYAKGLKDYACLIAVTHRGQLVSGVVKQVAGDELYTATRDHGAYLDGQRIRVSNQKKLSEGIVGIHLPTQSASSKQITEALSLLGYLITHSFRVRPNWNDGKFLSFVARGAIDAYMTFPNLARWYDVAPAILLIREAGGMVTNLDGSEFEAGNLNHGILASNGLLHKQLVTVISKHIKKV